MFFRNTLSTYNTVLSHAPIDSHRWVKATIVVNLTTVPFIIIYLVFNVESKSSMMFSKFSMLFFSIVYGMIPKSSHLNVIEHVELLKHKQLHLHCLFERIHL